MATEFTVTDLTDAASIAMMFKIAGQNDKGERFVLYEGTNDACPHRKFGAIVRLEDAEGKGFEVGQVSYTVGSFPRPILALTTFNSCPKLTAKVLVLCADERAYRDARHDLEEAEYQAKKAGA